MNLLIVVDYSGPDIAFGYHETRAAMNASYSDSILKWRLDLFVRDWVPTTNTRRKPQALEEILACGGTPAFAFSISPSPFQMERTHVEILAARQRWTEDLGLIRFDRVSRPDQKRSRAAAQCSPAPNEVVRTRLPGGIWPCSWASQRARGTEADPVFP